jgi:hypothetical protein
MKGITNIEFILSMFVFLTTITFIAFSIIMNIPLLHGRAGSENTRSLAFQFSEQIIFDEGLRESDDLPADDWSSDDLARIGLSSGKRYEILESKLDELRDLCSTREGRRRVSGFVDSRSDVFISTTFDGEEDVICIGPSSIVRNEFGISRAVVMDDESGIVTIKVVK